jgi:uncharacterized protein (DUF488 family)
VTERRVFLFGYSGRRPAALLDAAVSLDAIVLDIRHSPRSRNSQWSKPNLSRLLGDRYEHCPPFGNLHYQSNAIELADPEAGVAMVRDLLETRSVVLMCVCKDDTACHRRVAADLLRDRLGVIAVDLDTALQKDAAHQLTIFTEEKDR